MGICVAGLCLVLVLGGCVTGTRPGVNPAWEDPSEMIELLLGDGAPGEAYDEARSALSIAERTWGRTHRNTVISMAAAAGMAAECGEEETARDLFREARRLWMQDVIPADVNTFGADSPQVSEDHRKLVTAALGCGMPAEAAAAVAEAERIRVGLDAAPVPTPGDFRSILFPTMSFETHRVVTPEETRRRLRQIPGTVDGNGTMTYAPDDPFLTRPYESLVFTTPTSVHAVTRHLTEELEDSGWSAVREVRYLTEEGCCGREFLRVYARGNARLRLAAAGTAHPESDFHTPTGVTLDFIGIAPEIVLGTGYAAKGTERYDPDYHIRYAKEWEAHLEHAGREPSAGLPRPEPEREEAPAGNAPIPGDETAGKALDAVRKWLDRTVPPGIRDELSVSLAAEPGAATSYPWHRYVRVRHLLSDPEVPAALTAVAIERHTASPLRTEVGVLNIDADCWPKYAGVGSRWEMPNRLHAALVTDLYPEEAYGPADAYLARRPRDPVLILYGPERPVMPGMFVVDVSLAEPAGDDGRSAAGAFWYNPWIEEPEGSRVPCMALSVPLAEAWILSELFPERSLPAPAREFPWYPGVAHPDDEK